MAVLVLPKIQDNPMGWGPREMPEKFRDMPYQPFNKSDRLGKVADWTGSIYADKRYVSRYTSQFGGQATSSQYAYVHEYDDAFKLVDTIKQPRSMYNRGGRTRYAANRGGTRMNAYGNNKNWPSNNPNYRDANRMGSGYGNQGGRANNQVRGRPQYPKTKKANKLFNRFQNYQRPSMVSRKASVEIRSDWDEIDYYEFSRLLKLKLPDVPPPEDLKCCGTMEYYDRKYDKLSAKSSSFTGNLQKLMDVEKKVHTVTTAEDPIIRELSKKGGNVFATDSVLSTLMGCARSMYSWDILVAKVQNNLFFDKRGSSNAFDFLTVNETATEQPPSDVGEPNNSKSLREEATYVNTCFSQQVLRDGDTYDFEFVNPFAEDDDDIESVASVGYRYRSFNLGNGINLVCRCEHDAVTTSPSGNINYINVKSLLEFDHKNEWRQKLDSQPGAILATELKNNAFKIAKWCICAILAGSDLLKIGFISRINPRDSKHHEILKVQQFNPHELAQQINLNIDNCWGTLRALIDVFFAQPNGKYLILKDPNKPMLRLYSLPDDAFSTTEDEDDDEIKEETAEDGYSLK